MKKLISTNAKTADGFSTLSFHIKRMLLLVKWTIQGTTEKYKYRLEFWNIHRHVPYQLIDDYIAIKESQLFDPDWYLTTYKDVKNDNHDPLLHYILYGFNEGRDAGPLFSTSKYLDHYKDVKQSKRNALLHYLYHGKKEGRKIFGNNTDLNDFPYPASSIIADSKKTQQAINNQTTGLMRTNEQDFLKRKKARRDLTTVKTVAFIAQPEYFDFHYRSALESRYAVGYFNNSFSENSGDFKELINFDADINVFFRGDFIPTEVLNALGGVRVNLSSEPFPKIINNSLVYTSDSLKRFELFLTVLGRPFDYIFHYDEVSKSFFEKQGIELSGYFPFPIVTETIKPGSPPKKWDMFFSGRCTSHREQFFGPLKRDFNFLHINHGVVGKDLLDFINQCKISLNVHAENEISWEPRTQFLMASGSLLISEPLSPTCPLRPGIDFIEVTDPWNMYETCNKVLSDFDSFQHIAENGRKRIVEMLSSHKNFPIFFDALLDGKYRAPSFNNSRIKLEPLKVNLKYSGFQHLLTELLHEHA